jgi:type II secretory pathway predicted ATPase ExeA
VDDQIDGKLYETANVKLLRQCVAEVVEKHRCGCVVGDPGKQKTYVAKHLIAELNRKRDREERPRHASSSTSTCRRRARRSS